jgi:hypothetical protein
LLVKGTLNTGNETRIKIIDTTGYYEFKGLNLLIVGNQGSRSRRRYVKTRLREDGTAEVGIHYDRSRETGLDTI